MNNTALKIFSVNKDIRCIVLNYFNIKLSAIVGGTCKRFQKDELEKHALYNYLEDCIFFP